jgi:NADH:ubiquinone oxidoreductase subunit 5 (subunit L)/multisubunit Na+/H+ antiporter MnhA subunit
MLFVVSSISTMVHIYSVEYMDGDPHQTRFMCYISLFTFGMFILVSGDNFVQMFLG